ncbi:MAG: hypothetical protein HKN44_02410 [Ilumatobacter sp.]|nr:hypothetical protein [Ilumatobacter sp.]
MTERSAVGTLRVGDGLPSFRFADGLGGTWSSDAHRATGVPLVLILHRHLA